MTDDPFNQQDDELYEPPSDDLSVLIHDLGNLLTVALGSLKILVKRIESGKEQTPEEILSRLKKSTECLDKINARLTVERVKQTSK